MSEREKEVRRGREKEIAEVGEYEHEIIIGVKRRQKVLVITVGLLHADFSAFVQKILYSISLGMLSLEAN